MQRLLDPELILCYTQGATKKTRTRQPKLPIRMLMEDEYILKEVGVNALNKTLIG